MAVGLASLGRGWAAVASGSGRIFVATSPSGCRVGAACGTHALMRSTQQTRTKPMTGTKARSEACRRLSDEAAGKPQGAYLRCQRRVGASSRLACRRGALTPEGRRQSLRIGHG